MRRSIIVVLVPFLSFLLSFNAIAKTAAEVFEKTSRSVVVVQAQDKNGKSIAFGSGVILPNGDVATNCHVLEDAFGIKVYHGKKGYNASSRYTDGDRDVCSLSVPSMKAASVSVGNTKTLKVGSRVYAIGAPKGLTLTFSEGIISSLRPVEGGQYLQITAPISPGSSGGGLFDEGRLIGLTTFYIAEGQQLNFAVPVEWISALSAHQKKKVSNVAETYVDWLAQLIVFERKKNWGGLINHALKRIKVFPQDDMAWFSLGVAYAESGQTGKAIEAYQQALRINPEDATAWYNLGNAYVKSGQMGKAIEAYQQALRINPEDATAWYNLGNAYVKSGQMGKAIEAHQQALRINPEDATAWYNLGNAYYESGQTGKAIEAYQQALRINPEYANAWYNLGISYAVSGQKGLAMEVYKQLKTFDSGMAEKFFNNVILP